MFCWSPTSSEHSPPSHHCCHTPPRSCDSGLQGAEQQLLDGVWQQWWDGGECSDEVGDQQISRERLVVWAAVLAQRQRFLLGAGRCTPGRGHRRSIRLFAGWPNLQG